MPEKRKGPAKEPAPKAIQRHAKTLLIWWGAFLAALLVVMAQVLPVGGDGPSFFKVRRSKKAIAKAESMEREGLWHAAAEAYEKIAQDEKGDAALRSESSARLAGIYAKRLQKPEQAAIARERAIYLQPDLAKRAELRKGLGEPPGGAPAREGGIAIPLPEGSVIVAEVGGARVTMEDILYAWSRVHPEKEPTAQELQPFIMDYMDNILFSEEARRRGEDGKADHLMGVRFVERQMLARELMRGLVPKSEKPAVEAYYKAHTDRWMRTPSLRLRHILLREKGEAEAVGKRLDGGEAFEAVAKEASVDREQLPEACDLGWVEESEIFIPHLGSKAGLAASLVEHDSGYTTGPLQTARGYHWIKIADKRPASPAPLEDIYKDVESGFLKEGFQSAKEGLLAKLKQEIPIQVHQDRLQEALAKSAAKGEGKPASPDAGSGAPSKASPARSEPNAPPPLPPGPAATPSLPILKVDPGPKSD